MGQHTRLLAAGSIKRLGLPTAVALEPSGSHSKSKSILLSSHYEPYSSASACASARTQSNLTLSHLPRRRRRRQQALSASSLALLIPASPFPLSSTHLGFSMASSQALHTTSV